MKSIRSVSVALSIAASIAALPIVALSQTVYAESSYGEFGKLNITTGVFTELAPDSGPYAIAFAADGNLYGAEGRIVTFNLTTGITTGGPATGSANFGLAKGPDDNTLYATGSGGDLRTINLLTGTVTYVGGNGLQFRADGQFGATYNQNGVLYSALVNDYTYDQGIYSINTSTGAAALVHDFGIGHLLSGFVPIGTHLYSFDYINNAFYNRTNEIFDYTGGVLVDTHVAVTGLTNPLDSIIATAYLPTATPEPGSVALLAGGGIAGARLLKRRRIRTLK